MNELKEDDIIDLFLDQGDGIKKITKTLTSEEFFSSKREKGKKFPVDIIAKTQSQFVGYEVYRDNSTVGQIIYKINQRKERNPYIYFWVALLPYKIKDFYKANEYSIPLGREKIFVVWFDDRNGKVDFLLPEHSINAVRTSNTFG